ncbi:MAG: response regulator transcription factor [Marinilabiliaceae bacterium]|nr:response regulator transcription factor [Marinilabiliaceae bacterium]
MIKVAIVDDHIFLVEAMEKLINELGDTEVIDHAYSVDECWQMLSISLPDVLLLDVGLPDGDGCQLCQELMHKYPTLKILMLTTYAEIAVISRALEGGALGYVLKNSTSEEIHEGIRTVAAGEKFLCDKVQILLKKPTYERITLTTRERELLKLVIEGKTNAEIADKLCLAHQTVKGYRSNLIFKMQVNNTAEMVKMAIEKKLV